MNKPAPFTQRQIDYFIRAQQSWFNVAEGGKRGGKNVLQTLTFCSALENHPNRLHLIAGVSVATARLNIQDCDGFGIQNYFEGDCNEGKYKDRNCLFINTKMGQKIVLVSGGGKAGDERYIKGNTYGMVYITEANECHPDFIKETFDRTLSSDNRKIYHDLNPKFELHWYYRDILQDHVNKQLNNKQYGYNYGHFTIADNLSIEQDKLTKIIGTYDKKSIWYQRDILGLRKQPEGLVYDMWRNDYIYDHELPPNAYTRSIGIDFGTTNPTAYLDCNDDGDTIWVDNEYYYDSKTERAQKTIDQFADDLDVFIGDKPYMDVIPDPSALPLKIVLRNRGIIVHEAKNDVLPGIQSVSMLMANGKIRIHQRCKRTLEELMAYSWDEKAASERGEEQVIKQNDHALDALRYMVFTKLPKWRYGLE